jgi:hypothetical protein
MIIIAGSMMTEEVTSAGADTPMWLRRTAAVLEVLAVVVGSIVLQRLTQGLLGIELWPGIIAHALINLPIPNSVAAEAFQLAVMAGLLVWCHREAIAEWPRFRATMSAVESWGAVAAAMIGLVALMATLMTMGDLMIPAVVVMLVVALVIELFDRRTVRPRSPESSVD